MNEPEVELYDDQQYQISGEASSRRLAAARARARSWRRLRALGLVAAALLIPVAIAVGLTAARAPGAPFLVVTWPKPKIPQVIAPDQTILARGGQPFDVTITHPEDWDVLWKSGSAEQKEGAFKWAPTEDTGQLTALCQPRASGWEKYFSFLWPDREVAIQSTTAQSAGNYARSLTTGTTGAWVFPHVFAQGAVAWDERALSLLSESADLLPETKLNTQMAPLRALPNEDLWRLVSNFDGSTDAPSENGTFASFHGTDLENSLPLIASRMVKSAPDASIKFILRFDRDPAQGIVRIAYDGKRERKAWIRRKGDTAGTPLTGWEDGNFTPRAPKIN